MKRPVVTNLRNGMPILWQEGIEPKPDRSHPGALVNLPSYVMGAEYIIWEPEDLAAGEESIIRFRIEREAVAYLFLPKGTEPPAAWSPVRMDAAINRACYPEGVSVYMKRLAAESRTEISAASTGKLPPLIAVQERGSVIADIVVSEITDSIKTPMPEISGSRFIEEYEGGTELVLEAQVSPWRYSRRLPLIKKWYVSHEAEWLPLEGNQYTIPEESAPGYIRFRLELATPDGQIEYRAEKTIQVKQNYQEEQ
jgi:hypothetical protein